MSAAPVVVVLVNWRAAADTCRCLASLLALDHPAWSAVVVDNGSADGSLEELAAWLTEHDVPHALRPAAAADAPAASSSDAPRVTVYDAGRNLGFAGGCNVGLRHALGVGAAYAWLLNNDTRVAPDALSELVAELERRPAAGFCGSTLVFDDEPDRVQCLGGGTYGRLFATTRLLGLGEPLPAPEERERRAGAVRRRMDFVCGASLLVTRRVLEEVGLLDERFFLYFEELDWTRRAAGRFELAYAPRSLVRHAVGASIGSSVAGADRSLLSDYYGIRNRLLFTRRWHPRFLPTVLLGLTGAMLNRLVRGQPDRVGLIARLALWGVGLGDERALRARYGLP